MFPSLKRFRAYKYQKFHNITASLQTQTIIH